jgi:hypothetical protein
MARTPFIGVLVLFLVAFQIVPIGHLRAQVPGTAGHEHLTEWPAWTCRRARSDRSLAASTSAW